MRGRKPKPTKMKVLAGNPGKRPLNMNEPDPEVEIPECPKHLDIIATLEWHRISKELQSVGLLSQLDRAALAAYCQIWSRWVESELDLKKKGSLIETKKGNVIQNPSLAIAHRCMKQLREYEIEFGMTPSSRSRISGVPKKRSDEKTEKLKRLLGPTLVQ